MPPDSPSPPVPPRSTLWLWGFWVCVATSVVALLLSLSTPSPLAGACRVLSGILLIAGGIHNGRVVSHRRATRAPYSTFGFDAIMIQRQTGWSSIALGVFLVASAAVGL